MNADNGLKTIVGKMIAIGCGLWLLGLPGRASANTPEALPAEVSTAVRQWDEYFRRLASTPVEGRITYRRLNNKNGTVVASGESEDALNGANVYSRALVTAPDGMRVAYGENADYRFRLQSKGEGAWAIRKLDWKGPSQPVSGNLADVIGDSPLGKLDDPYALCMLNFCRGLVIDNTWLPYIVKSADFKVSKVEALNGADAGLVRIVFEYEPAVTNRRSEVRSGEVVLDTNRFWLISRAKVRGADSDLRDYTITVTNQYADTIPSVPLIVRSSVRETGTFLDGKKLDAEDVRELDFHPLRTDAACFRVSGFGMSEPTNPRASRRFWLYGNIALLALVGGGLFWTRRKSQKPQLPTGANAAAVG